MSSLSCSRAVSLASQLVDLQESSLERLWRRAIDANRVAKIAARPGVRNAAYAAKTAAVCQALRVAPSRVLVSDCRLAGYGIVGFCVGGVGGVHLPISHLADDVRPSVEAALALAFMEQRCVAVGGVTTREVA